MVLLTGRLVQLIISLQIRMKIDRKVDKKDSYDVGRSFLYKVAQLWHLSFWGLAFTSFG